MSRYEVEIVTPEGEKRTVYADIAKGTKAYHNAKYQNPAAEVALHDLQSGITIMTSHCGSYDVTVHLANGAGVHHDSCTSGMDIQQALRIFHTTCEKHPTLHVTIGRDPTTQVGE